MKKLICILVSIIFLFTLSACSKSEEGGETSRTQLRLLNIDIPITKGDIESVLGVPVKDLTTTQRNESVFTFSEDGSISVYVGLLEQSIDEFHNNLPETSEFTLTEAPNLGEEAWWIAEQQSLVVHQANYTTSVRVTGMNLDDDSSLYYARNLATIILNNLFD